ncbi:hypothetical protein ONZ45_g2841 [Pleurotus djamor]|nr:hypothetical protein ONZ45_g2841 [Pleurotus djamor]
MHPFSGNPSCPKCSKAVYAAEQVMGPGRMLYHKPCLACTMCNKRLDSLTLLEHNYKPYCKLCHVKHFGTKDLRQQNLPYRAATTSPPPPLPASPLKNGHAQPCDNLDASTPPGSDAINTEATSVEPMNHSSPDADIESEERDVLPTLPPRNIIAPSPSPSTSAATPPILPTRTLSGRYTHRFSSSLDSSANNRFNSATMGRSQTTTTTAMDLERQDAQPLIQTATGGVVPLIPTATGSRYGVALDGKLPIQTTGSPSKRWSMGTNPSCPKCGKTVYFAEQVKAIGKTFHKGCLRCTQCNTSLDSTKLTEKDGEPYCRQCYSKFHGPRGGGYALVGKAGG